MSFLEWNYTNIIFINIFVKREIQFKIIVYNL